MHLARDIGMSLAGYCLVASPHLDDPHFFRTVVLLLAHSPEGSMGVILNRPSEHSLKKVLDAATQKVSVHEGSLYLGGPVEGPLVAIHSVSSLSDLECSPGIFFTSNRNHLIRLATLTDISIRVFDGYAGWSPNQLEQELEQGGWLLCPSDPQSVFGDPDEIWNASLRKIGDEILSTHLPNLRIPDDPRSN